MHHLCPDPTGPVTIDPQPLTFLNTQHIVHPLCHAQRVGVQMRGYLYFSVFSACCPLTFLLACTVQVRHQKMKFSNLLVVS